MNKVILLFPFIELLLVDDRMRHHDHVLVEAFLLHHVPEIEMLYFTSWV